MMAGVAEPPPAHVAERIGAWSAALALDAVPVQVVDAARRSIVDTVGVTLAAATQPLVRSVVEHARHEYAPGASSVLGFGQRLSPVGAALANGTAGHALDFDDTSYTGIMHGSTVVLPAALAATEADGGDGRRLMEAFVAGSEVAYAVALLCTTRHYHQGWWSTATLGVFGAAAAAARALRLSAAETVAALGLAGAHAGGLKAGFGTDAKPYVAGRAAAAGVEAALLARGGLTGPRGVFEGRTGYLSVLNDGHADAASLDLVGRRWRLVEPGIFFKQYPVCSGAHAAVELTERLLREHALTGDDVQRVICEVTPVVAISLVYDRPAHWQEAQFSLPFAVGAMLARGRLDLGLVADATLAAPDLREAMAKVEMRRVDALMTDDAPEGARVTVITKRGAQHQGYLGRPAGMPGNPLPDARLYEKFARCAEHGGIDEGRARRLLRHLMALETAPHALPDAGEP
jgi:2-methylcitrate dehydratase PrpD